MADPVLVEVTRGPLVESRHAGAFAVVDASGKVVFSQGDIDQAIYPRSAIKALQALPLVETGAAERFGLTDAELALCCSSHSGEPDHVATAAAILTKAGRDVTTLECGAHWPSREEAARELARSGVKPLALHNNCSGKHAGFVCLACAEGVDPKGYVTRDHRVQFMVAAAVSEMTGAPVTAETACGIDGCSIPTFGLPLKALALGFARFCTETGLGADRAAAAARLKRACAAHPFMVAGTGRFCTDVMALLGARVFVKTGAEGVFCAAFPNLGLGIALKCADGAGRAAEVMMATLISKYVEMNADEERAFEKWRRPLITNWNGIEVGAVRFVGDLY